MRNTAGVYLGENRCAHYQGVDRMEEHTCCGGKKFNVAFSKCAIKGVVRAEHGCSRSLCEDIKEISRKRAGHKSVKE